MSNTISHRIYDFLKEHPPFNFISKDDLIKITDKITVVYLEQDTTIFKQGEFPPKSFYVVREGAVKLYNEFQSEKILIDVCDDGDIFGIRPLVSDDQPYTLTAVASEESLVYKIPTQNFVQLMHTNKGIENYFSSSFAAGIRNPYAKYSKQKIFDDSKDFLKTDLLLNDLQTIEYSKNPITSSLDSTIQEAAELMKYHKVGSIIIEDNSKPVGIITDRDLRNKVVAGKFTRDDVISKIMSSPVITTNSEITAADLQILMIQNNIHHVCITEDGTINSNIVGMVSEHDLLVLHGNNPSVYIRETKRAQNSEQLKNVREKAEQLLKKYLQQEVSIPYISRILSEINSSIIRKAIELSIAKLSEAGNTFPDVEWCWLSLGSQGRGEQLLRSDQDNAIVFKDVEPEDYEEVKSYFLSLASEVNDILSICGYDKCPANVMASNPKWCLSLSEWNDQFRKWIYTPGSKELMYTTIFFDFTSVFGNIKLAEEMSSNIINSIEEQESFLSFLARNALQNPPPLSFFRSFMVEHNGEHKDEFDIKARAMMPLVDGARVLSLQHKLKDKKNTIKRFNKLAKLEPENRELFEQLADAYEIVMRFRAIQGLKHNDSGRYFKPDELNKMQRLMLRNCFRPIKELQSLLTVRFNLRMFR